MDSFVDLNLAREKFENSTEDSSPVWKSGFNDFSRMDDTEVYRHCSIVWKAQCLAQVTLHYFLLSCPEADTILFQRISTFHNWMADTSVINNFPPPHPTLPLAKGIWQWSWCALEFWRNRVTLISDDICKLSNAVSNDKSRSFRSVPQWRVTRYPGTKRLGLNRREK